MSATFIAALVFLVVILVALCGPWFPNGSPANSRAIGLVGAICAVLLFLIAVGALHL